MITLKSKFTRLSLALLLCFAFMSPMMASDKSHKKHKNKIDWEIFIDTDQPITFLGNGVNCSTSNESNCCENCESNCCINTINSELFASFVPGSTYWIKGNLYPAGSVNPNTFEVKECKKIGEWYCTGTRVRNIFDQNSPVQPGELYEEAYFTYRLNDGSVIFTKQQMFFGETVPQNVFFSNVKGVKAGDQLISGNQFQGPPQYILVTGIKKVKN